MGGDKQPQSIFQRLNVTHERLDLALDLFWR